MDRPLSMPGVPARVELRLRLIAYMEGAIFVALILIASVIQPVWLAAAVLVVGMFGSGFAWLAILRTRRRGQPPTARKVPKA